MPRIYHQIGMRDWGPFTIPIDPYFPKLVWEFYASYRTRQQLKKQEGHTKVFPCLTSVGCKGRRLIPSWNTSEVPIVVAILLACIMEHVHINVGEIIVDQFRRKDKQQAIALPFPTLGMTPPSPLASSHIATVPANADESQNSPPPDLLNIAQRAKMHENQLEVATLTAPTNQPTPCGPEVVPPQVEAPRSPPDDWWVGYHSDADIISDEKDYHNTAPPPPMHSMYDVNPSWAMGGVATTSYHELQTFSDRRVTPGPGLPVTLLPDPMQPTAEDTTSWVFDVVTYTWKPRPNR
ncbi:hypothetical protein HAX54_032112 [Datura stramonium]|uniref:Uncharacterized protein n=1 Tax=Datura stramonium TaxID=4076 RepID=A0ABS8VAA0_DATST|nr:hypothetical protein [Datura stramonium]